MNLFQEDRLVISGMICCLSLVLVAAGCRTGRARADFEELERLAGGGVKPFVIVESRGGEIETKGQGVLVSSAGHVVTAGHVTWHEENQSHSDNLRVSLRTGDGDPPGGYVHSHKTTFLDRGNAVYHEYFYSAELVTAGGSRFIDGKDLSLLKLDGQSPFPELPFWSEQKPEIELGDRFDLCYYHWPHKDADPTFLINPIEVVGVVDTTSGLQYLAKGSSRWGSSGGAILRDGRLIGIQSSAYTINPDIGEVPMGLISFHVVCRSMFEGLINLPDW